jgi:hypothetical protein
MVLILNQLQIFVNKYKSVDLARLGKIPVGLSALTYHGGFIFCAAL